MATVSATLMNVLYAGIGNPLSISVPGVPMSAISATMTNGSLTREGDHWVAHPQTVGDNAVVTVSANMDGRQVTMASTTFRVRKLPDPTPYIAFKDAQGNTDHSPRRQALRQVAALSIAWTERRHRRRPARHALRSTQFRNSILRLVGQCDARGKLRLAVLSTPESTVSAPRPRQALLHFTL